MRFLAAQIVPTQRRTKDIVVFPQSCRDGSPKSKLWASNVERLGSPVLEGKIGTFRSDYDYEYEYDFWAREAWVLAVVDTVVAVASSQQKHFSNLRSYNNLSVAGMFSRQTRAACHNLVRSSDLSIPHSNKVDGLSCTQNAVLFMNVPNNPPRMNSDICNLQVCSTSMPPNSIFPLVNSWFLNIKPHIC